MLQKMKIRFAKVLFGTVLAIAPLFSATACDQSLGRLLDMLG
jgi:hypothetical protein